MIPAKLIPPGLRYCVAGGWAACPALASDVDVWVYGEGIDVEAVHAQLTEHLSREYYDDFEPLTALCSEMRSYEGIVNTRKVGKVWDINSGNTYEVMVCDASNPMALLDAFDISTHMVAINDTGEVIMHDLWTPPTTLPVVHWTTDKTPERLRKICARFGHSYEEAAVGL